MAQKFETAYRLKLTEAQARKIVSDIYQELHGEQLYHSTAKKFLTDWLQNKKNETTSGSYKRYENAVDKFLEYLAMGLKRTLPTSHKRDVLEFRNRVAEKTSSSTANTDLKILRSAFRQAVADGLRLDNPATAIKTLKERREDDDPERRPFTEAELKKLLSVATGEWRGIVLAGLYTGQRLGDPASMTWRMVDLTEGVLSFRTHKTNCVVKIPLAPPLKEHLVSLGTHALGDPVFPLAHAERTDADGESRRLSSQFHALLVQAGLTAKRTHKPTGKGRTGRRTVSELTFHSLRHNTTSWLKKAGVPESVVRVKRTARCRSVARTQDGNGMFTEPRVITDE